MTLDLLVPVPGVDPAEGAFVAVGPKEARVVESPGGGLGMPSPFGLYRDFSRRVWALSPDEVRELDPRWRP